MLKSLARLALSTLVPVSLFSWDNCCVCDDWSLNHRWEAWGEWLFMRRTELAGHSIVTNKDLTVCGPCPSFTVLSSNHLVKEFVYEPGYRVGVGFNPGRKSSIEAIYFNIQPWEASTSIVGDDNLSFPFNEPNYAHDYHEADRADAKYESRIWGAETNYWRNLSWRCKEVFSVSWLAGLRYFNLREFFDLAFSRHGFTSHYTMRTVNHIAGAQAGLNFQWNPTSYLSWDFTPKGGLFYTQAMLKTFLGAHNNTIVLRHFEKIGRQCTLMFEVPASLTFHFWRYFNFDAGYEVLYLTGVALAPEQMHKKPVTKSNTNMKGQILIHGLYLGLGFGF